MKLAERLAPARFNVGDRKTPDFIAKRTKSTGRSDENPSGVMMIKRGNRVKLTARVAAAFNNNKRPGRFDWNDRRGVIERHLRQQGQRVRALGRPENAGRDPNPRHRADRLGWIIGSEAGPGLLQSLAVRRPTWRASLAPPKS